MATRTARSALADFSLNNTNRRKQMPKKYRIRGAALDAASFDELMQAKIAYRRAGMKDSVTYANLCWALRKRFGRD
jgi:hypothetical protein